MKKKGKIIPLYEISESSNKSQEELEDEYFEEQGFEFEGWEAEYELTEAEDWAGLISYYNSKIERGQTEYCLQSARIYTKQLKQYKKAIEYLMPFHKKEPEIETIKQEIELAQNFINKKSIKLTKQDLKRGFNSDILRLFDFDSKMVSETKTFNQNLNMLFKKYEHVQVDTDNNIYAITKDTKDFITNNYDSYTTAYDLLHF